MFEGRAKNAIVLEGLGDFAGDADSPVEAAVFISQNGEREKNRDAGSVFANAYPLIFLCRRLARLGEVTFSNPVVAGT